MKGRQDFSSWRSVKGVPGMGQGMSLWRMGVWLRVGGERSSQGVLHTISQNSHNFSERGLSISPTFNDQTEAQRHMLAQCYQF